LYSAAVDNHKQRKENDKNYSREFKYPMIEIHINSFDPPFIKGALIQDDRAIETLHLFTKTVEWCKLHKLQLPKNYKFYYWLSDSFPWYTPNVDVYVPILSYSSSRNKNIFIIPDNTFTNIHTNSKYRGVSMNWDQVKKKMINESKKKSLKDKNPLVYFKGTDTNKRNHNLRSQFENNNSSNMMIKLNGWGRYEPMWEWSKYKFLLDLPGNYPWSNRLKFLPLTKSLIYHIDTKTIGDDYSDEPYDQFISYILEPGVDYININHTYFDTVDDKSNPDKRQRPENNRVIDQVKQHSSKMLKNDTEYKKIVESAFNKIKKLKSEDLYMYIYLMMDEISSTFIDSIEHKNT
jgi:hypothetical protein